VRDKRNRHFLIETWYVNLYNGRLPSISCELGVSDESHPPLDTTLLIGLDEPDEWAKFSQPVNDSGDKWESHLVVEGMHCAACAFNVEKALRSVKGVQQATVNATTKRAKVTWVASITMPSRLIQALSDAGYTALPANEIFQLDERKKSQRLMLWRLLVAGFCMMQVMMYAYPSYIADPADMTHDIQNLLRWASWILSLPVLLFSAIPFFSNAIHDIRRRQVSMDLPVALGILITFIVSSAATFHPHGWWGAEVYFDSLTMFVFFLLVGRWLELRMRDRTAGSLDVLMRRLPATVQRYNSHHQPERVAVSRLIMRDRVLVLPGEAFPADGVLLEGQTSVDEALLTGESRPVTKQAGDDLIAGSYNLSVPAMMEVKRIGADTRYGQIVRLMERASVDKPRLAIMADRIARPFLLFVLMAAFGAAYYLWPQDHGRALMAAVAVLIVTCPCALSLATPAAMLTLSGALANKGVLVQKMQAIETLTNVDTLIFDKTGTLSDDRLEIGEILTVDTYSVESALAIAAALAVNSLHPVSKAIVRKAGQHAIFPRFDEFVERREISGGGVEAYSKQGKFKLGSAKFCHLEPLEQDAASQVFLTLNEERVASFEVVDSVKSDAVESISALQRLGINIKLLSGDTHVAVARFASLVGIVDAKGNCTPQDKLHAVQQLQAQGKTVAMVGDGLNDGPVLALANTSIAMGQGVPLAQAQSDFIVMNNQIASIVMLMTQARRTMTVVKQNLFWAFIYNATCVPLAIAGLLPAWLAGLGMALSSLLVVLNALRLSRFPVQRS